MESSLIHSLAALMKVMRSRGKVKASYKQDMRQLWSIITDTTAIPYTEDIRRRDEFLELYSFFSPIWSQYISEMERQRSLAVQSTKDIRSALSIEEYSPGIEELSPLSGNYDGAAFAMIGCGPFPETMIRVFQGKLPFAKFIGIDQNIKALNLAQNVFPICTGIEPTGNVHFVHSNAADFDFSDISVALMANGLEDKKGILSRLKETLPENGTILVRVPINPAYILYECPFLEGNFHGFKYIAEVQPSRLSKTIILQKDFS